MSYFLFALTSVAYIALVIFGMKKPPGGDYGVGHAFMLIFLAMALIIASLSTIISMNLNGCFSFIQLEGINKKFVLGLIWIVFCISTLAITNMRWNLNGAPVWMKWLVQVRADIWWPLLLLIPGFILINYGNDFVRNSTNILIFFKGSVLLNILFCMSFLWLLYKPQSRTGDDFANEYYRKSLNENEMRRMEVIQDTVAKTMWLASHSASSTLSQDAFVKSTSAANWKEELLRVLRSDSDYWEAFTFAASYSIDLPKEFEVELEKSIRRLAKHIREGNNSPSFQNSLVIDKLNLEKLVFGLEQKFLFANVDYRAAMKELQEALTLPEMAVLGNEQLLVKQWIADNP